MKPGAATTERRDSEPPASNDPDPEPDDTRPVPGSIQGVESHDPREGNGTIDNDTIRDNPDPD